jgi:hypothetical protein
MGTFYEKISLTNSKDDIRLQCGLLDKVRSVTLEAMPDTGAWTLIINEDIRQKLGLVAVGTVESSMAGGSTALYDLTEAVEIRWKDRLTIQQAVVMPKANDVLLVRTDSYCALSYAFKVRVPGYKSRGPGFDSQQFYTSLFYLFALILIAHYPTLLSSAPSFFSFPGRILTNTNNVQS